jgi:hypothetical protein
MHLAPVRQPALIAALLLALALPAAAGAKLVVGVSDQQATTFTSPLFAPAKLTVARYVVPYDVTKDPLQAERLQNWLAAAVAARQRILISFEHSRLSREAAAKLPSPAAYKAAITAFKKRYGSSVHDISPWNEVDRKFDKARGEGQPTWNKPAMVARYYGVARRVFKGMPIVALDILDQQQVGYAVRYIRQFKAAVAAQRLPAPKIWGLHPYSDINRFSTQRTRAMLAATGRGDVWLTEASGIVRFGSGFPYSESRAAAANRCMFTISRISPRIKRLYVFGWAAGGTFDSGLVRPDGATPRPGYTVVKRRQAGPCRKP